MPDAEEPRSEAPRPETQEERALRTIRSIQDGADLVEETMTLANEFTDRHTSRFTSWLRALFRRPAR